MGLSETSELLLLWFMIIFLTRMAIWCTSPNCWLCLPFYPSAFARQLVGSISLIHDMTNMCLNIGPAKKNMVISSCSSPMRPSIWWLSCGYPAPPWGSIKATDGIPPQRYRWCRRTVPVYRRRPPRVDFWVREPSISSLLLGCYDVPSVGLTKGELYSAP